MVKESELMRCRSCGLIACRFFMCALQFRFLFVCIAVPLLVEVLLTYAPGLVQLWRRCGWLEVHRRRRGRDGEWRRANEPRCRARKAREKRGQLHTAERTLKSRPRSGPRAARSHDLRFLRLSGRLLGSFSPRTVCLVFPTGARGEKDEKDPRSRTKKRSALEVPSLERSEIPKLVTQWSRP